MTWTVHGDTRGQKWVSGPAPQKGGGGVPTVLRPQSPAHPSSENKHSESRKALPEGSSFTNGLCRHLRGDALPMSSSRGPRIVVE